MAQDQIWSDTAVPKWIPMESRVFQQNSHNLLIKQVFKVLDGIYEFQKSKTFCDITITVEGTIFQAHKVVLAASSRYFEAMLKSEFKESITSEANISGKPESFQILLDFAYSGKLTLTMSSVIDVLEMAHYLQFDMVIQQCESYLEEELELNQGLSIGTALRILSIADVYDMKFLKTVCKKFLARNFTASNTFLSLMTAQLMEEILDQICLKDEKAVSLHLLL